MIGFSGKASEVVRAINENNINIVLSGREDIPVKQVPLTIALQPVPIQLQIKTDTDWPTVMVGTGSILIALIVAVVSYRAQKNQVRANIAGVRAKWIEDFRELASKFLEAAILYGHYSRDDSQWLYSSESNELYSKLLYWQIKMGLMLDKTKPDNNSLIDCTNKITSLLSKRLDESSFLKISQEVESIEKLSSKILEEAWQDIKFDLNASIFTRPRK
nr:hypothetical protein [uncultured Deefgea sp.]